jgi:hypothetical protein
VRTRAAAPVDVQDTETVRFLVRKRSFGWLLAGVILVSVLLVRVSLGRVVPVAPTLW